MKKVALALIPKVHDQWMGGLNYLRNLGEAISNLDDRQIELLFITSPDFAAVKGNDFAKWPLIRTPLMKRKHFSWFLSKISQKFLKFDPLFERFLKKQNVELISHYGFTGKRGSIPFNAWIPDFQHCHLPELFSEVELRQRDKYFKELLIGCHTMILSSQDALNDLKKFFPGYENKTKVLQFVADIPDMSNYSSLESIKKFSGGKPWFVTPNQFFKHKNHEIIIKALQKIKHEQGEIPFAVLATGSHLVNGDNSHYLFLRELASDAGVSESFLTPGVISFMDLMSLMYHSISVLQPSKFEGWSTCVEESKTMGKQIILSNIPVHVEQNPLHAKFFDPDNANELSNLLLKAAKEFVPENCENGFNEAREDFKRRQKIFAETFQRISLETLLG